MTTSRLHALRADFFTFFMPRFCHLRQGIRRQEAREVEGNRSTRACCFVQDPVLDELLLSGVFHSDRLRPISGLPFPQHGPLGSFKS